MVRADHRRSAVVEGVVSNSDAALLSYAERIARVMDDADEAKEALKDLRTEVKSAGFDVPVLMRLVKLRRDDAKLQKERAARAVETIYAKAIGVQLELI